MQSFDHSDKFLRSQMIESMQAVEDEMEKPDVAYVRVGKFPKVGEVVTANGLQCKVIMANHKKRRFTVRLL